jgi:transcriptional regulator with XRE-family HTH domain
MRLEAIIKEGCKNKKLTIRQFAERIGMSDTNLYKCFKRNSIETKHLEKIAEVLQVPIGLFFEQQGSLPTVTANGPLLNMQQVQNSGNITLNALSECEKKIEVLLKEIEFKDKLLEGKDTIIQLLKEKVGEK